MTDKIMVLDKDYTVSYSELNDTTRLVFTLPLKKDPRKMQDYIEIKGKHVFDHFLLLSACKLMMKLRQERPL